MEKNVDSVLNLDKSNNKHKLSDTGGASLKDVPSILFTFILVLIGWIFFRANTLSDALYIIKKIISEFSLFNIEIFYPKRLAIVVCFVIVEWIQRHREHPLQIDDYPSWARAAIYYFIVIVILLFGVFNYTPFIYFKF